MNVCINKNIKTKSKDELMETDIKSHTCFYFDDITRFWDRDIKFRDILFDENSNETYENILIYHISYKTSTGVKPLHIRFDKIDGFIKTYNGFRCLVLFDYGWFDKICDNIKYLVSEKSGITDSINRNQKNQN